MPRPKKNEEGKTLSQAAPDSPLCEGGLTAAAEDCHSEAAAPPTESAEERIATASPRNDAEDAPESEVEALRRELAQLKAQLGKPADGVVELTFLASVSPNNVCSLGDYGSLNGVGGYIEIPRKEFGGKFMTPVVRSLLRDRSLIVCSGLSEEERKRYGVDYREGELLDMSAFDRLLDMPPAELTTLFTKLCPEHKEFAATRFITAYEKGDNRVSREKIEPLNDISKEINPKGMFRPILDGMNKA